MPELITKDNFLEETFNLRIIETETCQKFILYWIAILHLAVELNVCNETRSNFIASSVMQAIDDVIILDEEDEFEDKDIQINNYLYVLSMFLQTKSNWSIWLRLNTINSIADAKSLLHEAKTWLEKMLTKQKFLLVQTYPKVMNLNLKNITNLYHHLFNTIKSFMAFDVFGNSFNICSYYDQPIYTCNYHFLNTAYEKSKNLYDKLFQIIYNFCIELSIMSKIDASKIIKQKSEEIEDDSLKKIKEINEIDQHYMQEIHSLHKKQHQELNYYFESLDKPGRKKKGFEDDLKIIQNFQEKKEHVERKWKQEIKKIEKKHMKSDFFLIEFTDECSLSDLIKEYSLFSFSTKGLFEYPNSLESRSQMLSSLKLDSSIKEFLDFKELNEIEIEYLRTCTK